LLHKIFLQLEMQDINSLCRTCKYLYGIGQTEIIWKILLQKSIQTTDSKSILKEIIRARNVSKQVCIEYDFSSQRYKEESLKYLKCEGELREMLDIEVYKKLSLEHEIITLARKLDDQEITFKQSYEQYKEVLLLQLHEEMKKKIKSYKKEREEAISKVLKLEGEKKLLEMKLQQIQSEFKEWKEKSVDLLKNSSINIGVLDNTTNNINPRSSNTNTTNSTISGNRHITYLQIPGNSLPNKRSLQATSIQQAVRRMINKPNKL